MLRKGVEIQHQIRDKVILSNSPFRSEGKGTIIPRKLDYILSLSHAAWKNNIYTIHSFEVHFDRSYEVIN